MPDAGCGAFISHDMMMERVADVLPFVQVGLTACVERGSSDDDDDDEEKNGNMLTGWSCVRRVGIDIGMMIAMAGTGAVGSCWPDY